MTLKKTISGIRGTIGGPNDNNHLTPIDIVQFAAAYCTWMLNNNPKSKTIVIGRDARISGAMVSSLVSNTALAMGISVVDLGLSTTPTVEMAVKWEQAAGGIIITASHNPKEYNALKLLNAKGEFLGHQDAQQVLDIAEQGDFVFQTVEHLGSYSTNNSYLDQHIQAILDDELVDIEAIQSARFSILVDGINSSGGFAIPRLLEQLGVEQITTVNGTPNGEFAHNPEPLPSNLTEVCKAVTDSGADLGIVVDPDVDRLCFINEDGSLFGEEYTLVAVADYVLSKQPGNTVSNLSSTIALRAITEQHGGSYYSAAVGEVNVVNKMKEVNAIIGGEGNGGVIYPALHYGRDALMGVALFLTHLANFGKSSSELRTTYPNLVIAKNKLDLSSEMQSNLPQLMEQLSMHYADRVQNTEDGLKIYFDGYDWVHIRESNTEPIIRIYSESDELQRANQIAEEVKELFLKLNSSL